MGIGFIYEELKWPEIKEVVKEDRVVILPTGSIEQHGLHLPVNTDSVLVTEVCRRTAEQIPDEVLLMPTVVYGYDPHHMDFPGNMSIEGVTFLHYVRDIVVGLAHHGFKRVLIVNGHGSNHIYVDAAARQAIMDTEGKVLCAAMSYWNASQFPQTAKRIRESGPGGTSHACEFETSMYLAIKPELVDMSKAKDWLGAPDVPDTFKHELLNRPIERAVVSLVPYWSTISPDGVYGDATKGTKEKGDQLLAAAVEGLVGVIRDLKRYPIPKRVDHH